MFRLDKNILKIPVGKNSAYFDPKPLESALKEVIRAVTKSDDTPLADNTDPTCPIFVVAAHGEIADGSLKLFRSYGFEKDETPIWQAARATSAAPGFFPPAWVNIPAPPGWYVDGGLRANNPSGEAIVEGKNHWNTKKCFIVSIGTGVQKPANLIGKTTVAAIPTTVNLQSEDPASGQPQDHEAEPQVIQPDSKQQSTSFFGPMKESLKKASTKIAKTTKTASTAVQTIADKAAQVTRVPSGIKASVHLLNEIAKLSTSSESTHESVYREANSNDESAQFPYFRFNVLRGMDDIGLEEWRKVEAMTGFTRNYLNSQSVLDQLRKCAEGLVNPTALESM